MDTSPTPRVDAVLRAACERIDGSEARLLMAHALGKSADWLFAHGDDFVGESEVERFEALVAARAGGKPVAYLTGRRGFWTFDLAVSADTLIPRPETELLVELSLARLPLDRATRVADLGTGSGAIALALARERPLAYVVATDASVGALALAQTNSRENAIVNVEFRQGNWHEPLADEVFDLIASNPPYIADGDVHLQQGDLRFEPAAALSSGPDGLQAIREIVAGAGAHLHPGGWLLIEHGWDHGPAIRDLLQQAGFVDVATERDLESRDRVSLGRRR